MYYLLFNSLSNPKGISTNAGSPNPSQFDESAPISTQVIHDAMSVFLKKGLLHQILIRHGLSVQL